MSLPEEIVNTGYRFLCFACEIQIILGLFFCCGVTFMSKVSQSKSINNRNYKSQERNAPCTHWPDRDEKLNVLFYPTGRPLKESQKCSKLSVDLHKSYWRQTGFCYCFWSFFSLLFSSFIQDDHKRVIKPLHSIPSLVIPRLKHRLLAATC